MQVTLIQRIVVGFTLVLLIVIAISSSTFISQRRTSEQMYITSTTVPTMFDQFGKSLDLMRLANQAMLQHATSESEDSRELLRREFDETRAAYDAQARGLIESLAAYPDILTTFETANIATKDMMAQAKLHFDVQDQRVVARANSLNKLTEFASEFQYFSEDIDDLVEEAEEDIGSADVLEEIANLATQGDGVQLYLIKTLAIRDDKRFNTFAQELERYMQLMDESISSIEQVDADLIEDFKFYQTLLKSAISDPNGLFQQHLAYVTLDNRSAQLLQEVSLKAEVSSQQLDETMQHIQSLATQARLNADNVFKQSSVINFVLAIVSLFVAVLIASTIVVSIRKPLKTIIRSLKRVASGDLSHTITETYKSEMGLVVDDINDLNSQLNQLIGQIQQSASTISSVAKDNLEKSEQTNQSIALQRSRTESVAAAVTQMDAAVHEVANHAVDASNEVSQVTENAQTNMKNMSQNLFFANELKTSLVSASNVIESLSEESQRIGDILSVIQGIAEQTNLLALNAAIEAARAGEQGRGFAVVADEVRTLANRTQQSANEIGEMIGSLQRQAGNAVALVRDNLSRADQTVIQTEQTTALLEDMVNSLANVNDKSRSIASASEQQSAVAKEVAENIVQISSMTEDIEANSVQAAENSESLNRLSSEQSALTQRFKLK
ncbi:methyl-accepting chemotaxis protein [Reinekea sp.]|jgi:methyl-accepting chemotaxis protein|uniref:methyl-accepting chemotaxis protein n=1 Tax=Reinekea sp. TaxID=1970455 RepID=UPI00398A3C49